jgi:hypothetical protein
MTVRTGSADSEGSGWLGIAERQNPEEKREAAERFVGYPLKT